MNKPKKKPFWQVLMVGALSILMVIIPLNTTQVKAYSQSFLDQVKPAAVQMGIETGRFPSVAIAQAILESGWGTSSLTHTHNNILGITHPSGGFRSFSSISESMRYYGTIFTSTSGMRRHYRAFLVATTPQEAAHALTKTYAQDPNYGSRLISIMDRYNLYRFDAERDELIRIEQERLEAERKAEEERLAKIAELERLRLEAIRLESLKTVSLKYEEAYERIVAQYAEKYDLFVKLDVNKLEFDGYLYKLKVNERSLLEKGE